MLALLPLFGLAGSVWGAKHEPRDHKIVERQGSSSTDFGASGQFCTCPPIDQPLVEVNAYLPGARNYFLDCQYGPTGEPCTYNTAGAAVNPPNYCPANALPASTAGTEYCYVTCPASVGGSPLDTVQSNVVILASGTSYTTCRYQNGSNCQYNPLTGALGNTAAGGSCPANTSKTSGCCFNLGTSGGSSPAPAPSSSPARSTTSSTSSTRPVSSTRRTPSTSRRTVSSTRASATTTTTPIGRSTTISSSPAAISSPSTLSTSTTMVIVTPTPTSTGAADRQVSAGAFSLLAGLIVFFGLF